MRTLVILGLIALVCSSPAFLRDLQQDNEAPPANASNSTNSTNSTMLGTEGVLVNNSGVANHTDEFDFNMNLFEPNGNWTLVDSNCTQGPDNAQCQPTAYDMVDSDNATLLIMITYPNVPACQNLAGQTVNYTADMYIGEWVDNGMTGEGALRLNNDTLIIIHPDGNSSNAGNCYEQWSSANATNAANATNTTTVPTNKTWEGAWAVYKVLPLQDGMVSEYCCIPDQPVLITQDLASQTIVYAWRAPDCDACLTFRNSIQVHNISIVGGGGYDDSYGVPSFVYPYEGHLIFEMPECAYLLEPIPTTSCNATNTNQTNTTMNNGGSR